MSVEYCLVRVTSILFEKLQQQPEILQDLIDGFYNRSSEENREKSYIDSRDVIRGTGAPSSSVLQMLYFDEFTTSLLVNFKDEGSAFFAALAGWGSTHILDGSSYGYGEVSYYFPGEVTRVSLELNAFPETLLEAWFGQQADNFRLAAAGYFRNDQAILAHQHTFADLTRRFYNEAAHDGDFVLLLIV
jgi:hypothetical protein